MTRVALEAIQLSKLRELIAALETNPYYRGRIRGAGSLDEFRARLPFTLKQELVEDQRAHPPFGTNLTYEVERYTRLSQTSSTTGRSLLWLDTPQSWEWMLDSWERVFRTGGVTAADRIFFAFSFGMFLGFWTAFDAASRLGAMRIPGGGMSSVARLRVMLDSAATVLCCTPTYALRLAEVAAEEKIDLAGSMIRRIIVAGEPGGSIAPARAAIESVWPGARVLDHHGMTETGPVSYECPLRPCVLHVIETSYIAEAINPATGLPIAPGECGELVLTTLGRLGSPLLRYRTGDLVQPEWPERCACGSSELALVGGILGRTDDMVVVRGVNVYPSAVEDIVRASGEVAEYRVEIHDSHTLPELRVVVEPSPECADEAGLAGRLEVALRTALGLRIAVANAARGTLPRFEMKARRWVRLP